MSATEHERCAACGFDGGEYSAAELTAELRGLGPRWRALLAASGEHLRTRPAPEVWSALEYAAHSRDITALHLFGVEQALELDEPAYPEFDEGIVDRVATEYAGADPDEVGSALAEHAARLATVAEEAGSDQWTRGLTVGSERNDVRRLLEHALHDSLHHVDDVERGLRSLRDN